MAISSWTEICNLALYELGAAPIDDLDTDDSKNALACQDLYQQACDTVIEKHDWNCARTRKSLAEDATAPEWGWDYRYQIPTTPKMLRLIEIEDDPKYTIEDGYILCDVEDEINILYAGRITDPTKLTPWIITCIALQLAVLACLRLTNSRGMKQDLEARLARAEMDAKAAGQAQEYTDESKENEGATNAEWTKEGR